MSPAESTFGVPEPGNSLQDDPGRLENGDRTLTSPELVLVAGDEEAQRARDALTEVVPTDERILAEVKARSLRVAATAAVVPAAAVSAPGQPAPAPAPAPPPQAPAAQVAPTTVPAAPPTRRRPRLLFAAALVPVAALGLAFGTGWNPFGGSDDITPSTVAASPTPGQVGTATSAPGATTSPSPHSSTAPAASSPAHPRSTTTTPTRPTTHAGAVSPSTATGAPATSTKPPAKTTRPTRSATTTKPPAAPPTIQPSHVFAWPAAPNASFYLVSFTRDGKKVFSKRVTAPRLTLPGSFRFTAGSYRWTVVPATGTAANPHYAPAIIDSKFVVA
jgi:hypothetical protein